LNRVKKIKKRTGEPFKRIKGSELANLIYTHKPHNPESIFCLEGSEATQVTHDEETSEGSLKQAKNYVLIDVRREPSEFETYQIYSSINFPNHMFRRDRLPHGLYSLKQFQHYYIVVCADDEEEGIEGAKNLVQKAWGNVYLLSTSINKFLSRFTDLAEGTNPPPKAHEKKKIWDPKKLKMQYLTSTGSVTSMRTNCSTRTWFP